VKQQFQTWRVNVIIMRSCTEVHQMQLINILITV